MFRQLQLAMEAGLGGHLNQSDHASTAGSPPVRSWHDLLRGA